MGASHKHVDAGGRNDLLVADIEAMGKGQGLALGHVGSDILLVDLGLNLIVDQDHNNVSPLSGLGNGLDRQSGLLSLSAALGTLTQADAHVAAGILQVQGMGMSLRAVADDSDLLTVQVVQVAVLLIIHFCHD